jgi:nicotinamide riboside kinase
MAAGQKWLEAKFSNIIRTPSQTWVTVRLYAMQEANQPDAGGNPVYNRILLGTLSNVRLDAGEYAAQIVALIKTKMQEENVRGNHGYTLDQFLCDFPDGV